MPTLQETRDWMKEQASANGGKIAYPELLKIAPDETTRKNMRRLVSNRHIYARVDATGEKPVVIVYAEDRPQAETSE